MIALPLPSPMRIRNVTLPNRSVFSAHVPLYWPVHQGPNERALQYYDAVNIARVDQKRIADGVLAPVSAKRATARSPLPNGDLLSVDLFKLRGFFVRELGELALTGALG